MGQSGASIVRHDPHPVPSVRGADGASWYNDRPAGVALYFQRRKDVVEAQTNDSSRVLKQAPTGPQLGNEAQSFAPEPAVIILSSSLPGDRDRLTRWASDKNVNWGKFITSHRLDVAVARHVGPVLGEDLAAVRVVFHLEGYLHVGAF
uniref:Uncharacterized protein n=1 Tax=viral metagenome TaxID=1070528 RepID=A0A6M3LA94_9ZZZZ